MSKHNRLVMPSLCVFILALLLLPSLTGCTIRRAKAEQPKEAIEKGFTGRTERTYSGLQYEVMAFSDDYALAVWEEMDKVLKSVTDPQKRLLLQYRKVSLGAATMRIAAGRNPAANLLDMVTFVTLQHMVVREYWAPKVYGPQAQGLVKVHSRLEKEIWSIAGEMLTPAQLKELRNLIEQWRAAHPGQYYIIDVRLKALTELRGKSPIETEKEVNGLLGAVQQSLGRFDETMILAERAMFYFGRLPRIMAIQSDLLTDQLAAKPEASKLLGDIDQIAEAFKNLSRERREAIAQITDWLDKEHGRLVADLEAVEPKAKGAVTESRLALAAGNDLIKSIDAFYARMLAEKAKNGSPPVDYVKALEEASNTARQLQELVVMMDAFVAGEKAGVKPAALSKALNEMNAQSKAVLNHLFLLAAGLILLLCIGLVLSLLCYRYLARRLVDRPRP